MDVLLQSTLDEIKFHKNLEFDSIHVLSFIQIGGLESGLGIGPSKVVYIKEGSQVSASSLKFYNILHLNQLDFKRSLLSIVGGFGGLMGGYSVSLVFGLCALLAIFIDAAEIELSELDAKLLICIYRMGRICTISSLQSLYESFFDQTISGQMLSRSLNDLERIGVIKLTNGEVEFVEDVILERSGY